MTCRPVVPSYVKSGDLSAGEAAEGRRLSARHREAAAEAGRLRAGPREAAARAAEARRWTGARLADHRPAKGAVVGPVVVGHAEARPAGLRHGGGRPRAAPGGPEVGAPGRPEVAATAGLHASAAGRRGLHALEAQRRHVRRWRLALGAGAAEARVRRIRQRWHRRTAAE